MDLTESRGETLHSSKGSAPAGPGSTPPIVALTGGKGGVGKTSVAVNLALTLARNGRRVLLLDADTDLANVSILLGQYPDRTLEHAVTGQCALGDVIMEAPYGLHVIAGASGVQQCMDLDGDDADAVLRQLAALEQNYDIILIDTASGLRPAGLHMIALASLACVVITPDPASLTDAFSLLRVLQRRGYRRTPGVVVNMAAGASQAQSVYRRFAGAVRRHLETDTDYIGAIWRDESIRQSVELQRPVAMLSESDPSSRQFVTLADEMIRHLARLPARKTGLAAYWHHRSSRNRADAAGTEPAHATTGSAGPGDDQPCDDGAATRGVTAPEQCRELFATLERLLEQSPDDALLRKEALKGASALLLRMASEEDSSPDARAGGYSDADFGSQQALLARLKSQPDSVRVDGFLAAFSDRHGH